MGFHLQIQTHQAMAFLPATEVHAAINTLQMSYTADDAVQQFHTYFNNTWMDGIFTILLWNQYVIDSNLRTNNAVDGWHNRFHKAVCMDHHNIYLFVMHLRREQHTLLIKQSTS